MDPDLGRTTAANQVETNAVAHVDRQTAPSVDGTVSMAVNGQASGRGPAMAGSNIQVTITNTAREARKPKAALANPCCPTTTVHRRPSPQSR